MIFNQAILGWDYILLFYMDGLKGGSYSIGHLSGQGMGGEWVVSGPWACLGLDIGWT